MVEHLTQGKTSPLSLCLTEAIEVAEAAKQSMVTEKQISVKNKEFIMMRYGVVGVGYFGADLARFMNEFDDAQITMVYDPENGETIAQELQCVAAKSLEELVTSPDVDCVIVATPNYLHKEPVILAAKTKTRFL